MRTFIAAMLLATVAAAPLHAQDRDSERRIEQLESQIRALQRQVFPGGNTEFFQPDIAPGQPATTTAGSPASAPITDLTDRLNSLERQLANLTGQVEENSYKLRQLESSIAAMRQPEPAPAVPFGAVGPETEPDTTESPGFESDEGDTVSGNLRAMTEDKDDDALGAPPSESEEPPAENGTPFQTQGSEAALPDDPGEAAYVTGYRMWRDGQYAAARTQLRETVESYPGNRFESYARNLLGRSYLDDGKPANATEIFVRNYQELPNGERAADSLFYLGVALTRLDYKDRACLAYDELQDVYGATLRSDIAELIPQARVAAGCT